MTFGLIWLCNCRIAKIQRNGRRTDHTFSMRADHIILLCCRKREWRVRAISHQITWYSQLPRTQLLQPCGTRTSTEITFDQYGKSGISHPGVLVSRTSTESSPSILNMPTCRLSSGRYKCVLWIQPGQARGRSASTKGQISCWVGGTAKSYDCKFVMTRGHLHTSWQRALMHR